MTTVGSDPTAALALLREVELPAEVPAWTALAQQMLRAKAATCGA